MFRNHGSTLPTGRAACAIRSRPAYFEGKYDRDE